MTDFTNDINTLYDKVGMEIRTLNNKASLSREEIKAGLDAICLMHKIRHFEDDGIKYGWNEDGMDYSQRGWTVSEIPGRSPYSYAGGQGNGSGARGIRGGRSNAYPMYSAYDDRYSRHDGAENMISRLENLDDRDREAVFAYIDRLRG